jgi:hypothetical protein
MGLKCSENISLKRVRNPQGKYWWRRPGGAARLNDATIIKSKDLVKTRKKVYEL